MHKSYSTLNASSKRPYPIMDFEYGGERKVQFIWSAFPLRPLVQQASQSSHASLHCNGHDASL